ncbi:MAG: type II toxin-antitoxin system RelE/ParE family toxin [Chloroflexi bacterium]|nr:type II toxin-antitoxin system RelE/ParE family toxin [Chloroflexota bacterium]
MSYRHEWRPEAKQALDQLDTTIIHAILRRVNWLSLNFDKIRPKRLTAHLKGDFTLRVGDYRVIYSVNYRDKIIIIRIVGHRSTVYKDR